MYICLCAKFSDEDWYRELKLTGEEEIVEWNSWGDTIWGIPCHQINSGLWVPYEKLCGENLLGRLLIHCRNQSRRSLKDIHKYSLSGFDDTDMLKDCSKYLLENILPAPTPSQYSKVAIDNHTLPSERMKLNLNSGSGV